MKKYRIAWTVPITGQSSLGETLFHHDLGCVAINSLNRQSRTILYSLEEVDAPDSKLPGNPLTQNSGAS